jgi:transcriptional regulator of acetoin/glycerol metabolism
MGRASTRLHRVPGGGPALPGQRDPLAEARDRFLAAEPVDRAAVREPILASWWRSREWNVAANRLDPSYLGAPDLDTALTCWRRDADPLMMSLVRSTADQLTQALAETSSSRDVRLLQEYTRACRHTGGIVLALGNDVVMLNDHARQALSPADQAVLIAQATETLSAEAVTASATRGRRRPSGAVTVDLPSGAVARMFCRPVGEYGLLAASAEPAPLADGVVHVKLMAAAAAPAAAAPAAAAPAARAVMTLPGIVGTGAAWRRACRAVGAGYERGEWLALEGEPGVGKLALVRAVHRRRDPAGRCHVLDAADAARTPDWLSLVRAELLDGTGMLVLRRVHALSARQVRGLTAALQEARAGGREAGAGLRVAVTLHRGAARADLTGLLRLFPGTVEVPPLRHHSEDLRDLVPFFLGKLSQQGRVTCSPAATQLLLRHTWPGNAAQLWTVLKQVVRRRRVGQIMPEDLPPECWTVSRRVLSPLESIERDAIVQSLLDHGGNKIRAARALGMSRATIYRRIHEYGIVTAQAG